MHMCTYSPPPSIYTVCPASAQDLPRIPGPSLRKKKLEIFKAMGRVGSLRSQKYVQTFSKNALKIVPKCSPKPPQIDPQTLQNGSPNRIRKKTPILMPKGLPNGAPRAPQRLPFGVIFRTIFWTIFGKAPGTLPDRLRADSGTILAPFWLHFWSNLGSRIEEG